MKKLKSAGVLLIAVLAFCGYREWARHSLRAEVDEARQLLRNQGFKTELSDFDFGSPTAIKGRADAIVESSQAVRYLRNAREVQPMDWVGSNVAVAISQVNVIETDAATNVWPLIKEELAAHERQLDDVCASLFAGPVKFSPVVRPGRDILLPYLSDYKTLARTLAVRAVLAMRERETNRVFTNVVAVSRLVTGWAPEPFEVAHVVRFACVGIAEQVIWELMQTDLCGEAELAALQREWEAVRFFDDLPVTAELSCASMVGVCQARRGESYSAKIGGWGPALRGAFRSPPDGLRNLWHTIRGYHEHVSYQNTGTYEDEKALLFYYRDRRDELKRALECSTWAEIRAVPSATNFVRFQGAKASQIGSIMNLKQLSGNFQSRGRTLLGAAAEAEARRRLIVTAISLKRFAVRHGRYPQSLTELVPAFLPDVPIDFMDGKELHYRRYEDGRYLVYSVGLDCVDDGGARPIGRGRFADEAMPLLRTTGADLVWPLCATQADVDAFEAQENAESLLQPVRGHNRTRTANPQQP